MTNQNPASSQPLDRDLLAKLNAHADRSLDRLFTDIDELLSGDLESEHKPLQVNHSALSQPNYRTEAEPARQYTQSYAAQSDRFSPQLAAEIDPPQPSKPKQKKQRQTLPLWLKALLGVGVASIAGSSLLFWLVNERKISLPQKIDTSWLPFQSQSQIPPADAKFAEYMRKSIAKIESTNIATNAAINLPTPANTIAAPTVTTVTPTATPFNQATNTATNSPKLTPIEKPISLVKTLQNGGGGAALKSAVFQIDKKDQTVKIGQKIGTSNWYLLNISKNEATIKRKGGEIRSIKIGQKF
jgi:hypothetical protein